MFTLHSVTHEKLNMQDTGSELHRRMMLPAQKEFAVQFINHRISHQPHMTSESSSLGQQKQLNLNTMACKHQKANMSYPLILGEWPRKKRLDNDKKIIT